MRLHGWFMKGSIRVGACFLVVLGACGVRAHAQVNSRWDSLPIFSMRESSGEVKLRSAQVDSINSGRSKGHQALKLSFGQADFPSVFFRATNGHWDWSQYGEMQLKVENPADTAFTLSINFHTPTGVASFSPRLQIVAHHVDTLVVSLVPSDLGIRGLAQRPSSFDRSRIWGMEFFVSHPTQPNVMVIHEIRMVPQKEFRGIIDAFGQNSQVDWQGKVHSPGDLVSAKRREEAELASSAGWVGLDEYGGWLGGPTLGATGYFRTAQWKNKWWFVTPSGHLFISVGMNSVDYGYPTLVDGRESMFLKLPSGAASEQFYSTVPRERVQSPPNTARGRNLRVFNHFASNLYQKYGAGFWNPWHAMAVKRLHSWGFNTTANWYTGDKDYPFKEMPYTPKLVIRGTVADVPVAHDRMKDPFDPRFAQIVDDSLKAPLTRLTRDPRVVGYYVDNELPWGMEDRPARYALASGALSLKADSPAKRALVDQLRQHYTSIDALNGAWGTSISSWETLLENPFSVPFRVNDSMSNDLARFVSVYANKYFQTVAAAIKKYDSHHLYLGCRFKRSGRTAEVIRAAALNCDVVSFNIYEPQITPSQIAFLNELGKPCLIGEFHFTADDKGFFDPGILSVDTQQERADAYRMYVDQALSMPCFVGYHWFMYYDEPVSGALFGEDFNCGFVDVTDNPYSELVGTARALNAKVYELHAKP
jgi:hypothetical protein